ncbi:MAG: hypothetical protein IJW68_06160 [Bacteroidaceae bacterium]|nr:hypothetical protein [Bacteroidaceae bacterium]MBQ7362053.1 hypothetical protein [Bacteroidaceae bacterium]
MKSTNFKKWLPHMAAILFFFTLTALYFGPVFQGKDLMQADAINSQGWGKDLRDYHEKTGDYAYWSNAMFSGMPSNYTFSPQPVNVFKAFEKVLTLSMFGASRRHIGSIFLTFVCFYIFLISIGCRSWLAVAGSVAYTLCSYNFIIIEAGHMNKSLVMATMAPIIGGVMLCYRGKLLWGALITLIFSGLNIYWSHQQISYYLLLVLLILAVVYLIYAIREKWLAQYLKATGVLMIAAILALIPAIGQLVPAADYAKESMRGGAVLKQEGKQSSGLEIDYAYQWSYGIGETFTLLVPNLYGASSHYNVGEDSESYKVIKRNYGAAQARNFVKNLPTYWGPQPFTSGPVYVGAIVCFMFVLGLFLVKGKEKWWLLAATILSIVMAWGKYCPLVNEFLFYNLPLYNKFRAPSMSLVIASLTMVALGVLAIKELIERHKSGNDKGLMKALCMSAGITAGLSLVFALFGGSMFDFAAASDAQMPKELLEPLHADRAAMLKSDAWRSFIFIALAFALLAAWLRMKSMKVNYMLAALTLLLLVDLWSVDKRFLSWDTFMPKKKSTEILPTAADKLILADNDPNFRVLNLTTSTFNDSRTSYFHKSVGGYSPVKLRRYQDIIDHFFTRNLNMGIINMLNVKYFIVPDEKGGQRVQQNPAALGNCWFVDKVQFVENPNEEIKAIADFDPTAMAFIDKEWKEKLPAMEGYSNNADSTDYIRLAEYKNPGNLIYESNSTAPRFAVFSEVFYKTWKAYIDGKEVTPVRTDYILRGLPIPAGKHTIEFLCVDDIMTGSAKVSLYGSVFVGLVILGMVAFIIYRRRKCPCGSDEEKKEQQ